MNSERTYLAFRGWPRTLGPADLAKFDPVAIRLVRRAAALTYADIILSSSWRLHYGHREVGSRLGLPIVGHTPWDDDEAGGRDEIRKRGEHIQAWLDAQPDKATITYAILDDLEEAAVTPEQKKRLVLVDPRNGLSHQDYQKLLSIFGISVYGTPDDHGWTADPFYV